MTAIPESIFRYERPAIVSITNLMAQILYFASPREFNDPFDCAMGTVVADLSDDDVNLLRKRYFSEPLFKGFAKQQILDMSDDALSKMVKATAFESINATRAAIVNKMGVTCFSAVNDNLLMWAHYAGGHKGYCLEFRTDRDPFTKLREVSYVRECPRIDIARPLAHGDFDGLMESLLFVKSLDWSYEHEWRLVHNDAGTKYKYSEDALTAVYFGPEIVSEFRQIVGLIVQARCPAVRFYQGRRSKTEYKVEFDRIEIA